MDHIGKIINHLANLNRNISNQKLKKYNLTGNEGTILMLLKENEKIYQEEIVNLLQVDKSAVTRLLKNMELKGYIKRILSNEDKRYYLIELTLLGLEKRKKVEYEFNQKNIELEKGLSETELWELKRMLKIVQDNLERGIIDE